MAEFKYEALDQNGKAQSGTVNASTQDAAITLLQHKGLTLTAIQGGGQKTLAEQLKSITFFDRVSSRDLVILSRQIATLFEAQVSALRIFRLLAEQAEKPYLRQVLTDYSDRSYELGSKARNALIYPAFIMITFVAVMTLMLTLVIPKIGNILKDS